MGGRIHREVAIDPLPPRLGKIKCGIKSPSGYPQSVDYFVATGKYASLFNAIYGEKPQSILIYFPSDDPSLVCREEYVYRDNAGKKIATGDGETFTIWSDKSQSRIKVSIKDFPNIMETISSKYPSKTGWQITLTLNFVCPLINKIYGVWEFQTKGVASSIPQIRDCFDAMLAKNGKISGVLCDLNVEFAKSDSPKASRFPVVSLVPNETDLNVSKIKSLTRGILEE